MYISIISHEHVILPSLRHAKKKKQNLSLHVRPPLFSLSIISLLFPSSPVPSKKETKKIDMSQASIGRSLIDPIIT